MYYRLNKILILRLIVMYSILYQKCISYSIDIKKPYHKDTTWIFLEMNFYFSSYTIFLDYSQHSKLHKKVYPSLVRIFPSYYSSLSSNRNISYCSTSSFIKFSFIRKSLISILSDIPMFNFSGLSW